MGVEERKGRIYYYKKKRIGHRVVSEYVGGGSLVLHAARQAEERTAAAAAAQKLDKRKRQELMKIESEIDHIFRWIEALSSSELILDGYHQHKGEWRKRRNECSSAKKRKNGTCTKRPK